MDSRADTVLAAICVVASLVLLILPESPRDRVAGIVRGNLLWPLVTLQQRAGDVGRALIANDSSARVVDSLVVRSLRLETLEAENARMREILGLGRALRWGYVPAEVLVGRGLGEDHTIVLSAGERSGVEKLSAIVSAAGIVGMVVQVDPMTSIGITWPHPTFRVSATSADGSAFGIVTAHPGSGVDGYLLEMRGVPYRSTLRPGTPIVTSGLGGVFPRGVLIGAVMEELQGATGWSRNYLVRPAVRPADVSQVVVLQPDRNAEGVESVWLPFVQSALNRVSGAADSIAAAERAAIEREVLERAAAEMPEVLEPPATERPEVP